MDEKQMNNALNAIGMLAQGEITIEKRIGEKDVRVSTAMHPFIAIWAISSALEEMLYRAGETEDDLQLDFSGGNARRILHGIADQIADDLENWMEEKDHGKTD